MSAWEQVFQKIGHLLHIVCPMNADGPQLRSLAARGTPSWSRKIWKAWALTGRSSSKHLFLLWCRCVQACNRQLVLDKFNSPTQPVAACSSLQHRNAECNFPGPKMTQGWHVSLAAKATPSWSKSAACVIVTKDVEGMSFDKEISLHLSSVVVLMPWSLQSATHSWQVPFPTQPVAARSILHCRDAECNSEAIGKQRMQLWPHALPMFKNSLQQNVPPSSEGQHVWPFDITAIYRDLQRVKGDEHIFEIRTCFTTWDTLLNMP